VWLYFVGVSRSGSGSDVNSGEDVGEDSVRTVADDEG
jgi:hypothetical protein